jgi:hypothetical protein
MCVSAEARFITRCVCEPADLQPRELQQIGQAIRDWHALPDLAARHGVVGYVRRAIARDHVAVPPFVAEGLRNAALAQGAHVARLNAAIERILAALEAATLPAIVLKGPVLSRLVYPEPNLRPYSDIDLTVREPDELRVVETLLGLGLEEVPYAAEIDRLTHADHVHGGGAFHRVFTAPTGGVTVELHLDPLQMGLRPTREAARWERARPLDALPGALMLSPEDQIIQLSVHVHKHGFSRLIWLKDIDLLVRTYGDTLDWQAIRAGARAEGVAGSVWYTLWLAGAVLATPAPSGLLRSLAPSLPVRVLYRLVWPPAGVANLHGHMRRRAVQFLAADSWRGMVPNLVLMGRRGARLRAMLSAILRRRA